ncbi:MAG: TonB-dependent receptor plug domain-containing protein [Myxococcales bacterium]|nr:TonB-dependent receptor plug domain-containing protein [Myxococcales bacterium]
MTARGRIAVGGVLLACLHATSAHAEDTSDLEGTLDTPVTTTASHAAETTASAPATVTVVTAEDLRRYGILTLDQALDFLSRGVTTGNPLHQVDVGARGVLLTKDQGNHFLLLVNGHAMNEPLFGSARFERGLGISLEEVDHIEVMVGPSSVLYGSNAMLGVVNVITKRAKDYGGPHLVAEAEPGKSWRAAAGIGLTFGLFGKPAELVVQLDGTYQYGPAFTVGPQDLGLDLASGKPIRWKRDGSIAGVWGGTVDDQHYAIVPGLHVRLVRGGTELNVFASSYKRAWPFFDVRTRTATTLNDPDNYERDRSLRFDLSHRLVLSPIVSLYGRLYADGWDNLQNGIDARAGGCVYPGTSTCHNVSVGLARWGGVELRGAFDWRADGAYVTTLGLDARRIQVGHKYDQSDLDTGKPLISSASVIDAWDSTLGAYLQQAFRPSARVDGNVGARLDVGEQYHPVVSPRAAVGLGLWRGGVLKVIYAEAFRAPTWYERGAKELGVQGAGELAPERVRAVEADLEHRFGTHRLFFGAFFSRFRDLIAPHVLTRDEILAAAARGEIDALRGRVWRQYRNVDTIDDYGGEIGADGSFLGGALRYGLAFTSALALRSGTAESDSQTLPVAPHLFGNARLSYSLGGNLPTFALVGRYVSDRPADRAYDGGFTPLPMAPAFVELRFTVTGKIPGIAGVSYRAGVNWISADRGPYVIGPIQSVKDGPNPELVPMDRLRAFVGLRYDLDP